MTIKIKRLYELADDFQTLIVGDLPSSDPSYYEVYAKEVVEHGISRTAFTIRAKTFYEITLSHIPQDAEFVLSPKLSKVGLMYNYNRLTQQLFIYNCTQNQIYIEQDENMGVVFNG